MKKLLTLLFALIAMASTLVAQDEVPDYLCFKRVGGASEKIVIHWMDCGDDSGKDGPPGISYSNDSKQWSNFQKSNYKRYEDQNLNFSLIVSLYSVSVTTDCNIAKTLYLRSSNVVKEVKALAVSTHNYEVGNKFISYYPYITHIENIGNIYVSGNFGAMSGNSRENYRTINKKAWDIVFSGGDMVNNKEALKYKVVGVDMSFFDPMAQMYYGWSNLSWIKVKFDSWGKDGYANWVKNVAKEGVFICPRELEIKYGSNYIPENWQVVYLDELRTINIPDSLKDYISIAKTEDIVPNSNVNFNIKERKGYNVTTVTVSDSEQRQIPITNKNGLYSFAMPEDDVTISMVYTPIKYRVTTNKYCFADKSEAFMGDTINITIPDREGYVLGGVEYYYQYIHKLSVTNNKAVLIMPNAKVDVDAWFSAIKYNITSDEYVTPKSSWATIEHEVAFTVKDRTSEGYTTDKVLINGKVVPVSNYTGSFEMKDFLSDVTIKADYSKINYFITKDDFTESIVRIGDYNIAVTKAGVNDNIRVTFTARKGYELTSATYNGTALAINNYKALFTMPAAPVEIKTFYTPIPYAVSCSDANITVDKTTATIEDKVNITIKDRTTEGYKLDKVLVNSIEIAVQNYQASFDMKDYMKDITITAQYTINPYTITTDEYSQVSNNTANVDDAITITFKQREGYTLTSATYNGAALSVNNYKSSFKMPAANVEIKAVYAPIAYDVSCADANITADKTTATIEDKVNLTIKDRTSEGYKLDKVLVNSTEIAVKDFKASFDMKDYLKDVTISAQYSQIAYTITTDEYSQVVNTTAAVDDAITVTFKQREGFDLVSATYNGNPLNINNYKASFSMPAQDVEIKTVYAEKEYEIAKPLEGVSVSQPSAKAGDEITISVNPKNGYTVHLYVNGAEVALSGNSAVYTMPSGKIEITVKYVVEEKTPVSEIELDNCDVSVFPNPAKSGEEITLKVGGKFDMNNAKIYLYNASGSLVMQIDNVKEYNQLTLRSGVYVGVLVTKGGKKTFRVAVK